MVTQKTFFDSNFWPMYKTRVIFFLGYLDRTRLTNTQVNTVNLGNERTVNMSFDYIIFMD